jgi:hypothetical protein
MASADLLITFTGMSLVGYGNRGEAWLVDTNVVQIGDHVHRHDLIFEGGPLPLQRGTLVTFHLSNGDRLGGPVDFSGVSGMMVDLNTVFPGAPQLNPALLEDPPALDGEWTNFLAAWIRLPSGNVAAQAKASDVWPFALGGVRQLAEQFTITVPNVTDPEVHLTRRDGPVVPPIKLPLQFGKFRVGVSTVFNGSTPSHVPAIGDMFSLDEVKLIYALLTNGASGDVPARPFNQGDLSALPRESSDVSVCPTGDIRI